MPKFRVGQVVSVKSFAETAPGIAPSHSRKGWYHGWAFGRILEIFPPTSKRTSLYCYKLDGWNIGCKSSCVRGGQSEPVP